MGKLAEGSADRALSTALRATNLSEKSVPQSGAHEARGVPRASDRAPDSPDARAGDLGEARSVVRVCRPSARATGSPWSDPQSIGAALSIFTPHQGDASCKRLKLISRHKRKDG